MDIPLKQYVILLRRYLGSQRKKMIMLGLFLLSNTILQLLPPQIIRLFIDSVIEGSAVSNLIQIALTFIAVAVLQQIAAVLVTYRSEDVGWTATNQLRADLLSHSFSLDMAFHNEYTPGEMIERIDGDITVLSNFFSKFVVILLGNGLLLLGILIILLQVNWVVGLSLATFIFIAMLVLGYLRNVAVPYAALHRQSNADLFSFLEERLGSTEDIRTNDAREFTIIQFFKLSREVLNKSLKSQWMASIVTSIISVLFALGVALALGEGAYFYQTGLTIGTVYLIYHYATMLSTPINYLTQQVEDLQRAGASIGRVQELLQTNSRLEAPQSPVPLCKAEGMHEDANNALAVEFQSVSFGYGKRQLALQDISFQLEAGRVLGVLGRTGSGKTTIIRLLFRLYDPESGTIKLSTNSDTSQTNIRDVSLRELRQSIGMVTQKVQLFQISLRDNLTFWNRTVSDEQLVRTLDELGLSDWYRALPDGLDTILDFDGSNLSAGEAQLLAFTRVFLRNPNLVILDEASSRLDPATEVLMERAVDKLLTERTGIIIAHRLSTIQRVDDIMILENGRIIEYGCREELTDDPTSHFYALSQKDMGELLV